MNREQRYLKIVAGETAGPAASLARIGLAALEPLYRAAVSLRNASYNRGWRKAAVLQRPVISIGNLTVGGTGKTPLVAWLSVRLREQGLRPAVLMRGYKARGTAKGDEQRLLEALLGDAVPVGAGPDRVATAARVLAERPDVGIFVLDDGFQHRRVQREVDLVLIDATQPFGYERLLPRGLLREPIGSLKRAGAVIVTRRNHVDARRFEEIRARISANSERSIFACEFINDGFVDAAGHVASAIPGNRALAVSGIGNARAFADDLRRQGLEIAGSLEYGDHHCYTAQDIAEISRAALDAGVPVVTTMKDWMKLQSLWPANARPNIYIARQRPTFAAGDAERLMALIASSIN